jgi:hypothetical protein
MTARDRIASLYATPVEPRRVGPSDDWFLCTGGSARKGDRNELPLISCSYRDCTRSRQHAVDHEQGLQERLSRVVRSNVHRMAPHENSAPCLICRSR